MRASDPRRTTGAQPPAPAFVFRPSTSWIVGAAALVALALWVAIEARQGPGTLARRLPQMAVFAIFVGAVFIRPCVEVDADGVTLRNVVRDVRVPFAVLSELKTEFSLTLTDAGGRSYQAWSAPAASRIRTRKPEPARFPRYPTAADLPVDTSRRDADSIARAIRQMKAEFDRHHAGGVTEAGTVSITWSWTVIASLAVAVLLTVALAWWG